MIHKCLGACQAVAQYIRMLSIVLSIVCSFALQVSAAPSGKGRVQIDDTYYDVVWSDGDSFRITSGRSRGQRVRLLGYNTLESYGPVHKWGDWNAWALYRIAKEAKKVAISETWTCHSEGEVDRYQRLLVRCPKLIEAMLRTGMGHIFEVKATPSPALLAIQHEAMRARRGMWEKGVPEGVMTSIHSYDENPQQPAYNRVASLRTGMAQKRLHSETYKLCQWVCIDGSCLLYVPYQMRYGDDRPACLRWKR